MRIPLGIFRRWRDTDKLNDYAKVAEAAKILGVSQNTLRAWAEAGKIPVHRNPANGYRLFLKADLEKFLRKVEASGTKRPTRNGDDGRQVVHADPRT